MTDQFKTISEFDVDKVVAYLQKHKSNILNLYNGNFNIEKLKTLNILSVKNITDINEIKNKFEREIYLKPILKEKLNYSLKSEPKLFKEICAWIVEDWGGITTGKNLDTDIISSFLSTKKLPFSRIASFSKITAALYPDRCIIYDSRVAHSLNWILLSVNPISNIYFPIPEGRNSKMAAFDLSVLIRLNNSTKYRPTEKDDLHNRLYISNKDKHLFIQKEEAYFELNRLIKNVHSKLWSEKPLYYTEMLLYSMADTVIFKDIINKASLKWN